MSDEILVKDGPELPVEMCACGTVHERAVPPPVIPAPYPPRQYGPVRVLFEERFGGFIGFEWDGGLYSVEAHLPPDVRAYLPKAAKRPTVKSKNICKQGHTREPGKPCRMCKVLATRRSREKVGA